MICFGSDSSEELKNLINNFTNNSNSNHSEASHTNSEDDDSENSSNLNIDFDTIMKMKKVMDALNTKKSDPRANLLRSLKPYLRDERKNKVEQYVQILNMSSVFDMFKKNGGDENSK